MMTLCARVNEDAQKNGWQVISDTSWEGYEEIPVWVMQGYTTMFSEVQQQLVALGELRPHAYLHASRSRFTGSVCIWLLCQPVRA